MTLISLSQSHNWKCPFTPTETHHTVDQIPPMMFDWYFKIILYIYISTGFSFICSCTLLVYIKMSLKWPAYWWT